MAAVQQPVDIADVPPRKKSSITKAFLPFRSKRNSPRSSIDSNRSSIDIDLNDQGRRLSKSLFSRVDSVQSNASVDSKKLRKKSTPVTVNLSDGYERDRVTGETKDHTNMLHSLAHEHDIVDKSTLVRYDTETPPQPGSNIVARLSDKLWQEIVSILSIADRAAFALSCKDFRALLQNDPFQPLNEVENFKARVDLLYRLNNEMPNHLLCYTCALYHVRSQSGKEALKATNIANPLFECPHAGSVDPQKRIAKHRITFGRHLPYPFVQLAMRHHHHSPEHGIPHDNLAKRYKDRQEIGTWSHHTRYAVIEDHLYMRVVSFCFAPPNLPPAGERHLLYSREDFVPFFSVCAHWRDGELMPSAKCALSHVPKPLEGSGAQRVASEIQKRLAKPQSAIVTQCDQCKPLRRCPECPTEYLIEVRLQEDRSEKDPTKLFKHALVVTRWSDLGDGTSPWSSEWAAVNGDLPNGEYDSFERIGRRAISGVFESFFNPEQIPPARLVSLNPNNEKLGEKGHRWY